MALIKFTRTIRSIKGIGTVSAVRFARSSVRSKGFRAKSLMKSNFITCFREGVRINSVRKRKLFERTASQWARWWEQHWAEHVQDVTYSHVNLAVAPVDDHAVTGLQPGMHFKTGPGSSGYVVQSVFDPAARRGFP